MKRIIERADGILSGLWTVIGLCLIVLAFFVSNAALQVVTGLVGLGFIGMGLACWKHACDRKADAERFDRILSRLDAIQQELEKKEEQPRGSGVAIADVISSSLKYYAEHMKKDKDGE